MKTMSVGEFKTYFSDVIERVKSGERIAVTFGRKKEIIGYFLPELPTLNAKRKLGILKGKAKVEFKKDFKITEEEFLDL
ncbi:MAG TPA: hypothetical protein VFI78_03315 [Salinimicrobium sp.]|nr:hypothetical protein [Salinimicrobium sp.]